MQMFTGYHRDAYWEVVVNESKQSKETSVTDGVLSESQETKQHSIPEKTELKASMLDPDLLGRHGEADDKPKTTVSALFNLTGSTKSKDPSSNEPEQHSIPEQTELKATSLDPSLLGGRGEAGDKHKTTVSALFNLTGSPKSKDPSSKEPEDRASKADDESVSKKGPSGDSVSTASKDANMVLVEDSMV